MNGFLIGRFQPFHLGHLEALRYALSKVERLFVGIGSSNKPIQKKNPFTAEERKEMILSSITESISKRIQIFYIPDFDDHEKWIKNIEASLPKFDIVFSNDEFTKLIFSKHGKPVNAVPFEQRDILSGTNIRKLIISGQNWQDLVPRGTQKVLEKIHAKDRLSSL